MHLLMDQQIDSETQWLDLNSTSLKILLAKETVLVSPAFVQKQKWKQYHKILFSFLSSGRLK